MIVRRGADLIEMARLATPIVLINPRGETVAEENPDAALPSDAALLRAYSALVTARRELLASLNRLPAHARFQVILYHRTPEVLRIGGRTDLVLATAENKREVARLLETARAGGAKQNTSVLHTGRAPRPVPSTSRMTPPRPVLAPPYGSMAEG